VTGALEDQRAAAAPNQGPRTKDNETFAYDRRGSARTLGAGCSPTDHDPRFPRLDRRDCDPDREHYGVPRRSRLNHRNGHQDRKHYGISEFTWLDHRDKHGTTMMKRLLLIAAAVLAFTGTANADPLPNAYLGRWCFNGNGFEAVDGNDWKTCLAGDGYMEIKRNGWIAHEENCRFISIKHTEEKIPREDVDGRDVWKGAWRPVLHITARCTFEDDTTVKRRMTFKWLRGGGFSITER
jgi:hypothetical protein